MQDAALQYAHLTALSRTYFKSIAITVLLHCLYGFLLITIALVYWMVICTTSLVVPEKYGNINGKFSLTFLGFFPISLLISRIYSWTKIVNEVSPTEGF